MVGLVTYAQNFEDVMLWRALHGVGAGFYIDVGAADPDEDSVTRTFYDHGWRGVNIEPSPDYYVAVAAARPRDINLCCLVGARPGEMNLYNFRDTGLSTVERTFADRHAADGRTSKVIGVPVRTLADICREFAPPDIHFLKIDVEGAEADVLRGADFATYRPWIVVVEATEPNSQVENWQRWDPLLTRADYNFVWFDGLNRFYLAAERTDDLRQAFRTPPNLFDRWIRPRGLEQMAILNRARAVEYAMQRLREETARDHAIFDTEAAALRSALEEAQTEIGAARAEIDRLRAVAEAREQTEAPLPSTSWKVNAPLRGISTLISIDPRRRQRLVLLADTEHGGGSAKAAARIAIYCLGRAMARLPGSRIVARIVGFALPGPYRWLFTHYSAYREIVAPLTARDLMGRSDASSAYPQAARPGGQNGFSTNDLSDEEQAMLLRLRPCHEAG